MVDRKKVNNLCRMVVSLIELEDKNKVIDDAYVRKIISDVLTFSRVTVTPEEAEELRKDIYARNEIKSEDGVVILGDYNHFDWYTPRKEKIDNFYWERYRNYLLQEMNLSKNVVDKLSDKTLEDLMNCLGDPLAEEPFLRRGLIIGDVQSGKTSTYIGLICKAADAGYRAIILLTGTIESLRAQTQQRVESGFIGFDSQNQRRVGVGLDGKPLSIVSFTSKDDDFTGNKDTVVSSIEANKVIVFVIKKNVTVLRKLYKWLETINANKQGVIDKPMLLIDDEADNASVNTHKPEEDPTQTNKLIRQLLSLFTKSNYVGFTATPFANVFIDPVTTSEMENADLFPSDFIYALEAPSNYIGPKAIFGEDGQYRNSLNYIVDAGEGKSFFHEHTKLWAGNSLPGSLTEAIISFLLINAVRDIRGDQNKHRSMLINMSRFISVQFRIEEIVTEIFHDIQKGIEQNIYKPLSESLRNPIIQQVYSVWTEQFESNDIEVGWDEIQRTIVGSIGDIVIKTINSLNKKDRLNYDDPQYTKRGLRVIAIGGSALSRGLTLEGLCVSYFYRNSSTYDVLMQMGRWFGYRKNYDDLFRIWIDSASADWYKEIAEATNQLKNDIKSMRLALKTPKDFGIRVRDDNEDLQITASNKMRTATQKLEIDSFFGKVVETVYLKNNYDTHAQNYAALCSFTKNVIDTFGKKFETENGHPFLRDIEATQIIDLLSKIDVPSMNIMFSVKFLVDFVERYKEGILSKWDVVFLEGPSSSKSTFDFFGQKISLVNRQFMVDPRDIIRINRLSAKLGGPTDTQYGLSENELKHIRDLQLSEREGKIKNKDYLTKDRKPLLMVYLMRLSNKEPEDQGLEDDCIAQLKDLPAIGFAIGFPSSSLDNKVHNYKVNKVYIELEERVNSSLEE